MLLVKTYLAKSKIHGIGVFAGEFIPKGKTVWRLKKNFDRVYTPTQFAKLPEPARTFIQHHGYAADGRIVLTVDHDSYMNHSENANTFYKTGRMIARRTIKKGEEITNNYRLFDPVFCAGFLKKKDKSKKRR